MGFASSFAVVVLLALSVAVMGEKKVIIDTDGSLDDYIAITYAALNSNINLAMVSVTGTGAADAIPTARTVTALLRMLGKTDTKVVVGASSTVTNVKNSACGISRNIWNGGNDIRTMGRGRFTLDTLYQISRSFEFPAGGLPDNVKSKLWKPSAANSITAAWKAIVRSHVVETTYIVLLGGLTNAANFIEAEPAASRYRTEYHVLGGALSSPGNVQNRARNNTKAEFNIYADPVAAKVFLEALDMKKFVYPLDVTTRLKFDESQWEELVRDALAKDSTDFIKTGKQFVATLMKRSMEGTGWSNIVYFKGNIPHALGVVAAVGDSDVYQSIEFEDHGVTAKTDDGNTTGALVLDPFLDMESECKMAVSLSRSKTWLSVSSVLEL